MAKKKQTRRKSKSIKKVTKPQKKPDVPATLIQGCEFNAIRFDEKACNAVIEIAKGLSKNAEGLAFLARAIGGTNIHMESMLTVGQDNVTVKDSTFLPAP